MRLVQLKLLALVPVLGLSALLVLSGCKDKTPTNTGPGPTQVGAGKPKDLELAGYAKVLRGRVTYNGSGNPDELIQQMKVTKDHEVCGATVPGPGWYVKDSKDRKGIRYVVVTIRPPAGYRMPEAHKEMKDLPRDNKGQPVAFQTIHQPKCQFEPRVIVLHPAQKIQVVNDDAAGKVVHDTNISHSRYTLSNPAMKPGTVKEPQDIPGDDREPGRVSCQQHTNMMSAYLWKFTHPYATVTDSEGNFELKYVPVPKEGKMVLVVWHEMLETPDKFKVVGPIEIAVDGEATMNIELPK
jgi:hypothetical protein